MTKNKNKDKYKDAGVNIDEGQKFIDDIKNLTSALNTKYSLNSIGGFSGYIEIPKNVSNPVYALACDGVGTKMRVALRLNDLSTIGIDLVAMCVNDLIVSGAKPVAFLDYYGCTTLDREKGQQILKGILEGCLQSDCDLVGGETAEMPDHYKGENFDLVGFSMGVNDKETIIDGSNIAEGNIILGLPSSGFHSNGFSLINKIIDKSTPNELLEKLKSNLHEVRARGGQLFVFADSDAGFVSELGITVIDMPHVPKSLEAILYTLPLQLLSYHVALLKGTDVDQPRNLAKSVTVE